VTPPPPPRRPTPRAVPPAPPAIWVSEFSMSDPDLRIQALSSLMQTDAVRVIPILREIALESKNPNEARRAVFVLAQSGRPDAHSTVFEVAKRASEPVSVAAVRELGRFGGPRVSNELLQLYGIGNPRVKFQIVNSLGEREATGALLQIAQSEADQPLRDAAIVTLGQAGGRTQLQRLYVRARPDWKRPIITGLFNARAEDELIQIAERETDAEVRREVLARLRLLGTPKAKQYLQKVQLSR
jgi:HEAT repeat protein